MFFLVDMNVKMIRPRFTFQINKFGWERVYITLCYLMNCVCPVNTIYVNYLPLNCDSKTLLKCFSDDKVTQKEPSSTHVE